MQKAAFLYLVFSILLLTNLSAQSPFIPKEHTNSSLEIAEYLRNQNKSDVNFTGAAYNWVADNLRYDSDSMYYFNWSADFDTQVAGTLRRRKGVCENYSALFKDILTKGNVPAFVVHGYSKPVGRVNPVGHAWVAALVEGKWWLFDPTWDAGAQNDRFFMREPEGFITTHMPYDPLWQLLPHPYTHAEYKRGKNASSAKQPAQNVRDSVANFLLLDSMARLQASGLRMLQAGIEDNDLKLWYAYNSMKISIIKEAGFKSSYDEAIDFLNKAVANLNEFITLRNNEFKPAKSPQQIKDPLLAAKDNYAKAIVHFNRLKSDPDNYQYDPSWLEESLQKLEKKIADQEAFLESFLTGKK